MKKNSLLRSLPSISELISRPDLSGLAGQVGNELVTYCARRVVSQARSRLSKGANTPSVDFLAQRAADMVRGIADGSMTAVINATGVLIHTNLGRAPMGARLIASIAPVLAGYCNLEFDLASAQRGKRDWHVAPLLSFITGAEGALVVNNNAAACMLVLNTFARGREVIISRGELIEIGGEFRIPDILKAGGATMVEVGTTNKTRLSDYAAAIGPKTAMIFKAHKSNFSVHGFTEEVSVRELSALARKKKVLCVYDVGSGLLRQVPSVNLGGEPDVQSAIKDGADLVTFSADKLLAGPQAGVIAGKASLVSRLAAEPMMRALRVGKLTMAALVAACGYFINNRELSSPLFAMMSQKPQELRDKAEELRRLLSDAGVGAAVVLSTAQVGGGSLPDVSMKSWAVMLTAPYAEKRAAARWSETVFHRLLAGRPALLGILRQGTLLLDVTAVGSDELPAITDIVRTAAAGTNA